MSALNGHFGSVKFDKEGKAAALIAGTRNWSLTITKDTVEIDYQNNQYKGNLGSSIVGNGTCELVYDKNHIDAMKLLQQVLLDEDKGIALFELFLDGENNETDNCVIFDGVVTDMEVGASTGEVVTATVSFVTNGTIEFKNGQGEVRKCFKSLPEEDWGQDKDGCYYLNESDQLVKMDNCNELPAGKMCLNYQGLPKEECTNS